MHSLCFIFIFILRCVIVFCACCFAVISTLGVVCLGPFKQLIVIPKDTSHQHNQSLTLLIGALLQRV
jgi:hypothetical protein